jgi:4-hydroxy-tetrahydrodipicolinate reductase
MTRYRVVQWATGDVGKRALRETIRHPNLDLVGVLVYDSKKSGLDAGEICGEGHTGIRATTDRDAIFGLKADCVLYMPRATGAPHARAGLTIPQVLDDVCTPLEAGTNVVTTCTDFHAGGHPRLGEDGLARLNSACKRGNSSLYASGSDPGFISEQMAFAFLSTQRHLNLLEIIEYGDVSKRPSPHMIFDQMGFGKSLADFSSDQWAAHLHEEYCNPLRKIAEAAGFTVERTSARGEVAGARKDTKIAAGEVKAGTVAAQRFIIAAHSGGKEVVRLDQYAFVTTDVEPAWDIRKTGWRVRVDGDAPFDADLTFPIPPENIGQFVPAYNANLPVNAIPYLCTAAPGILTIEDMPPIVPRGPQPHK